MTNKYPFPSVGTITLNLDHRTGIAKLKIKEMGSRYLFILLYIWLEKYFSRGDYKKSNPATDT